MIRTADEMLNVYGGQPGEFFDLGSDPARYIVYPGGNAYYYAEALTDALDAQGIASPDYALDRALWEFLHPRVQRVISAFQRRSSCRPAIPAKELERVHSFDRRRAYYLRTGRILPRGARLHRRLRLRRLRVHRGVR